ncbi:FixH family protein [Geomonas ferrireducens]|uniref:FixH family protein n=1 Tax=Geomonas ferrireducens TaxID=2570227 RepID=UPI0010A78987|nr:FixH family protein [Geomonas ferrireducens]
MQKTVNLPPCRWQLSIMLMIAVFLLGMAGTMLMSMQRGAGVTDAQYYENGLNYDRTKSGARNPGLNWSMSASLAGRDLQVRVQDEKGVPITGGALQFRTEKAGNPVVLSLTEASPGVFVSPWPANGKAELKGLLVFTKGEASASQKVVFFN